jgi:hypothetical protein
MVYWRRPEQLPVADDISALAAYWKTHYNTPKGKGKIETFIRRWNSNVK